MRAGLEKPPAQCDPSVNKDTNLGRFFQFRFEITGHCNLMSAIFAASLQPQPLYAQPLPKGSP